MGFAYEFDWGVLWRQPYGVWLLQGLWLTIKIGFLAWIIAFFLGVFVGTLRVTPWRWLRFIAAAYTEVFRNIPFLVQLFFWYYAGPMLFGDDLGDFIPGVKKAISPEKRQDLAAFYREYWGVRWFILPNPMYGSWQRTLQSPITDYLKGEL